MGTRTENNIYEHKHKRTYTYTHTYGELLDPNESNKSSVYLMCKLSFKYKGYGWITQRYTSLGFHTTHSHSACVCVCSLKSKTVKKVKFFLLFFAFIIRIYAIIIIIKHAKQN